MRIFENIECKAIRVGSELTCISENIKGTLRLNFDLESHFPKTTDHIPAAFIIDLLHPFHIRVSLP